MEEGISYAEAIKLLRGRDINRPAPYDHSILVLQSLELCRLKFMMGLAKLDQGARSPSSLTPLKLRVLALRLAGVNPFRP